MPVFGNLQPRLFHRRRFGHEPAWATFGTKVISRSCTVCETATYGRTLTEVERCAERASRHP